MLLYEICIIAPYRNTADINDIFDIVTIFTQFSLIDLRNKISNISESDELFSVDML